MSTSAWLCACLSSLTGGLDPKVPPGSWAGVARMAEAEALAPALGFGLARRRDDAVPGDVAARLAERFRQALARHVVMSRDLATLLRSLEEAAIPVIPLKGAFLAETVYPHPAARPMSDVDVLVKPGDRLRVDAVLRGLGYRPGSDAHSWTFDMTYDAATFYDGPEGARVDVHWRLVNDPRYAWNHVEADGVWDRAVSVTLAGERALALCPEDLVLALATHLAIHHGLSGLLWYWDLKLVLDCWSATLDWDALVARATRWRVRSALFFVLRGLAERFALPDAVHDVSPRLAPRGPRPAALCWLVAHRSRGLRDLEHVIPLLLIDRLTDLLGGIGSAVVPSPAWIRARYGARSPSLVRGYLAHGGRMAAVVGRAGQRVTGR